MAVLLTIHGAWYGGWAFDLLRGALEGRGHRLVSPDLPGIGGDEATLAAVTLDGWADFVAGLARAETEPVILCGHSRGGIIISEAAERAPEAVKALVYVSAFLIPSGRCLNDLVDEVPRHPDFAAGLSLTPGGAALQLTPEGATAAFYHRSPEQGRALAIARMKPEPLGPLGQKLNLSTERYGRIPRHYIECSDDQAIPLAQQRAMQAALPCITVATLDSDHSPFLTCPDRLVEEFDRIARL